MLAIERLQIETRRSADKGTAYSSPQTKTQKAQGFKWARRDNMVLVEARK